MKRLFVIFLLSLPLLLSAGMGPDVSQLGGKSLKWEEGAWDYFTMFKTLLRNDNRTICTPSALTQCNLGDDQPGNPQADACMDPSIGSTFTLISSQVPSDARVQAAYLIWVSSLPYAKVPNGETDNAVTLSFNNQNSSVTLSADITATENPMKVTDQFNFNFSAYESISAVSNNSCTDNASCAQLGENLECIGGKCSTHTVVYTYRADVTDFFDTIHEMSNAAGISGDGTALLGNYTVTNMECSNDPGYLITSGMVGGWALVFVYTSEQISPKKIYFYDGFEAYRFEEGIISTSGFELPNEAVVRFTMISSEGDPGLASATNPENAMVPPPPEGLAISGAQKFPVGEWLLLWNDCNNAASVSGLSGPFNYTEVFNSISSTYGWADEVPFCVGGNPGMVDPNLLEYAMDVDTFILSAKDEVFAPHLIKGDQFLNFKIGANQDQIYTNLIVVSIDTKAPKFDIPKNPDTPDGREKNTCTCSETPDFICSDRPFYFTIKVENWGENIAENVTVEDSLPRNVNYIAGSTEMLTTKDGVTGKWEKVEDASGGTFPFTSPKMVMDSMYYCDKDTFDCRDRVMIRFKVKPIDTIQKNETVDNTAIITDSSGIQYFSNSSISLRLKQGNCPSITDCPEPPKELCGPSSGPECTKKEDCEEGYDCKDEKCVKDTGAVTKNAVITYAEGKNNPTADGSSIIIPNPSKNTVTAQFTLMAEGEGDKSFMLNSLNVSVFASSTEVAVKNIRLVYDENGDGEAGSKEKVLATVESAKANVAALSLLNESDRAFVTGKLHYFIIVADAAFDGEPSNNDNFNLEIEGPIAFLISDNGKPDVKGEKITFATFKFEPANGFIVTKGKNDPQVPSVDKMKGMIPVLQLRTKSMQGDDTLKSIAFKPYLKSVKLGEGINGAVLYLDKNSDGKIDSGDTLLSEMTSFSSLTSGMFTDLNIKYSKAEEKHLLIALDLKLSTGQLAHIQVSKANVSPDREIVELPVTSKEFKYECAAGDPTCAEDEEESGCAVTTVDNGMSVYSLILAALLALSAIFGLNIIRK